MKKLGIWLFALFIFMAAIYAVTQSEIGKNFIRNLFTNALKQSGYEVQIGSIEGTLPHQINLKNVTVQGKGLDLTIAEVQMRPILWRLLKKEIAFKDIHAKQISFSHETPFDFDGKFRMTKKRLVLSGRILDWIFALRFNPNSKTTFFNAQNHLLRAKGKAVLNAKNQIASSNIQISSDKLLPNLFPDTSGRFLANLSVTQEESLFKGELSWQIPNLVIEKSKVGVLRGKGDFTWQDRHLIASLTATPKMEAKVDLQILPNSLLTGTMNFSVENIQSLHIPHVYGKLNAKTLWDVNDGVQGLHLDIDATDFYYETFFAQKASLYSDLSDPLKDISGLFDLHFENAKYNDLEFETLSLETTSGKESWGFTLFADGKWKHPIELRMDGTWKDHFSAEIEHLTGIFYDHPFVLNSPVHFEMTKDLFQISPAEISLGDASLFFQVDRKKDDAFIKLHLDQVPLDFLSLNPLDVSVAGKIDLDTEIREENNQLQGFLKASIDDLEVAQLGISDFVSAKGQFHGKFGRDLMNLEGNIYIFEEPIFTLDVLLPIHVSVWPFSAEILPHNAVKGKISVKGRVENVLDFFDLGPHRLEGSCEGQLFLSNTLYRPILEGSLQFRDGFYQNYYTGLELRSIQADFLAKKNTLYLQSFTATDAPQTGALSATGEVYLLQSDHYPFFIDTTFTQLKFAGIDLVSATADGELHIEGNALSAIAKGDILIGQTELSIPNHIPKPVPNLQVSYRNPIHPTPPAQDEYEPYPIVLDVHVLAPNTVSISGRGLSSKWKGDFHLGGTLTSLAAQGNLELISGEFNFASKSFKLIDGSVLLSGVEHEMPSINLAGTIEAGSIQITARLKGPLDDPQITLQSNPPLPLGSIMSYLLFGQDISEVSGFQALQLANSLASLAGTGPDVLENTRRALGVDHLRIISSTTEEGSETVALEVGKYVSEGVLVTFTQGAEESSSNISVEFDLKSNIVFQIQSDQHQEQGKFTLKWKYNY